MSILLILLSPRSGCHTKSKDEGRRRESPVVHIIHFPYVFHSSYLYLTYCFVSNSTIERCVTCGNNQNLLAIKRFNERLHVHFSIWLITTILKIYGNSLIFVDVRNEGVEIIRGFICLSIQFFLKKNRPEKFQDGLATDNSVLVWG